MFRFLTTLYRAYSTLLIHRPVSPLKKNSILLSEISFTLVTHHVRFFDFTECLDRHTHVYYFWWTCKRWSSSVAIRSVSVYLYSEESLVFPNLFQPESKQVQNRLNT